MTVLVDEIGALAAENVATILTNAPAQAWPKLVEGGWAALGADPDAELGIRGLQEIARTAGRYETATPLVPTLLAGRWFRPDPQTLASGVSVALPRGDEVVAPYITDTIVILDVQGNPLPVEPSGARREEFSHAMPLAVLDGPPADTALAAHHTVELHAVLAAVAVGCVDAVADRSVEWAQTREQFGRPIKAFQAVRHHLANLHIAREQAWTAAIACAHEPDTARMWSRQTCELATTAIELGIQVHGGVGFTEEVGLHHFLNHVLQIESLLGSAQ
ncbi:acyl-CoA dehydrogenase [Micromonospora pallida]|uniref:Acyl-CoA dehydrogenase n=1 Tax=Micromonospora pallida TaxID=145854 RepID=A0A1C6RSJ6_9ACTN|nr:acyl-CoA dehydrogenase family protein [Micromonospora pallida]SCL20186.1 acyl-CoA dehydrogenase [Micromonospora pallida]